MPEWPLRVQKGPKGSKMTLFDPFWAIVPKGVRYELRGHMVSQYPLYLGHALAIVAQMAKRVILGHFDPFGPSEHPWPMHGPYQGVIG